jgi:DNA-binding GntR family transcriptional regulator/flavin reductase (DIM6/NTAB) family NADH-FMN oxidoreductase RutF
VDPFMFRQVIGHFASGVTVLTTRDQDTNYGLTASAVTSLTLDPPMLLACVNLNTGTQTAISRSRVFAVNILSEDQGELALKFGRPQADKFQGVDFFYGQSGAPLLTGALAHIECRVAADVVAGTHKVFLSEVEYAEAHLGAPLTYFRGKFGRFELVQDEAAYHEIREHVLSRNLALGDTLGPVELASKFNAAQSSVSYALTRLATEGLVSRDLVKGYVVTPLDVKTADDTFDARCAIEVAVADQTVGRLTPAELAELRQRMEATVPWVANNRWVDLERYTEANTAFHEYLVSLAKNNALLDAYRRLSVEGIMWRILARTASEFDQASDELTADHRRIVEAYEAGDVARAKQALIHHNDHSKLTNKRAIELVGGRA